MDKSWQMVPAVVVSGHRVASGANGDPRFPGGTLRMQAPHFRALGLDLSAFHFATLNVSIAPASYRVARPWRTFYEFKWHPTEPAEDFSFFEMRLLPPGRNPVEGLIYFPHPETKPEHLQQPDVLELLMPWVEGLHYGSAVRLEVPAEQMVIT